jgi:hypothetical protein
MGHRAVMKRRYLRLARLPRPAQLKGGKIGSFCGAREELTPLECPSTNYFFACLARDEECCANSFRDHSAADDYDGCPNQRCGQPNSYKVCAVVVRGRLMTPRIDIEPRRGTERTARGYRESIRRRSHSQKICSQVAVVLTWSVLTADDQVAAVRQK